MALILLATLILAPFIVAETLSSDYLPALVAGGSFALIIAFFFLKEKLSVCPLLGYSILGSLNFLPIPVGAPEIASLLLIVYYVAGFVLLTQRPITIGKPALFWPILILNGLVFYHVHTISLMALGGNVIGTKPALSIYFFTIAYFCGINLPTPSLYFLSRIPFYTVCLTAVSSIPFLLSTYYPGLAPYLYAVTDSVNVEAYVNTKGGTENVSLDELTTRLGVFGPLGASLQLYLLSHYPVGTWFGPKRLWVVCLSLICFILVVFCGFRSTLFAFFFTTFVGMACYYSWRAVIFPAIIIMGALVFITAADNNIVHFPVNKLPMIAQRTMSFLPGDWDERAIEDGKRSDEFRRNIVDVYLEEYAQKSPLFGNGFAIDKDEVDSLETRYLSGNNDVVNHMYLEAKLFIETKSYHTGWVSVYDCIGFVGWAAFVWFQLALIFVNGRFIFGKNVDRRSSLFPLHVWIQCSVTTGMVAYYTVFGRFDIALVQDLAFAILLGILCKIQRQNELTSASGERKKQVEFSGLSQASYGNKYY